MTPAGKLPEVLGEGQNSSGPQLLQFTGQQPLTPGREGSAALKGKTMISLLDLVVINNESESQGQENTVVFTGLNVKMFPLPSPSCPREHSHYHLAFISTATLRNAEAGSD